MRWTLLLLLLTRYLLNTAKTCVIMEVVESLARYICLKVFDEKYAEFVRRTCNGCVVDHPSQNQHVCMDPDDDTVAFWCEEVWNDLSDHYIYVIFVQALVELKIHPGVFEISLVRKVMDEFRIDEADEIEVSEEVKAAVQTANDKIVCLTNRIDY